MLYFQSYLNESNDCLSLLKSIKPHTVGIGRDKPLVTRIDRDQLVHPCSLAVMLYFDDWPNSNSYLDILKIDNVQFQKHGDKFKKDSKAKVNNNGKFTVKCRMI